MVPDLCDFDEKPRRRCFCVERFSFLHSDYTVKTLGNFVYDYVVFFLGFMI